MIDVTLPETGPNLNGFAPNTAKIYRAVWRSWAKWCALRGASPVPTQELVNGFLADMRLRNRSPLYLRHFASVLRLYAQQNGGPSVQVALGALIMLPPPPYMFVDRLFEQDGRYWVKTVDRDQFNHLLAKAAPAGLLLRGSERVAEMIAQDAGLPSGVFTLAGEIPRECTVFWAAPERGNTGFVYRLVAYSA